jgi:uncharacterized protein (TIGR00106 family)
MAVVGVSVVPLGTGEPSVSRYVAGCEDVLNKYADLKHKLTPMSTVIEGDLDRILQAIREMHEVPFKMGAKRVSTRITIDDRRDKELTMDGKIEAVEKRLKTED